MRSGVQESDRPRVRPGRHGLAPEAVETDQRQRLFAAVAAACAVCGYPATRVTDICSRAGVSTATFYSFFDSKLDCMLAAHEALLGDLLSRVAMACGAVEGEDDVLRMGLTAGLATLAAEPAAARLLTVEIIAAGPQGVARHHAALDRVAALLRSVRPTASPVARNTDWARAAMLAMLVGRASVAVDATASLERVAEEFLPLVGPGFEAEVTTGVG